LQLSHYFDQKWLNYRCVICSNCRTNYWKVLNRNINHVSWQFIDWYRLMHLPVNTSVFFYEFGLIIPMIYVRIRLHHISRFTMHYADLVTSKATYISVLMFHVQALINIKDIIRNHVYPQSCHRCDNILHVLSCKIGLPDNHPMIVEFSICTIITYHF
jgi:hypothetical protein